MPRHRAPPDCRGQFQRPRNVQVLKRVDPEQGSGEERKVHVLLATSELVHDTEADALHMIR